MASLGAALRSFWHTMTSNDRHSSYDSPYRTGRHVPLANGNGRHSILTSVATASESRTDVTSPYRDEAAAQTSSNLDLSSGRISPYTPTSPNRPYSPGLRSQTAQESSQGDGFETHGQAPGDVQMQAFENGIAPPPPAAHSWQKIDAWCEDNYPELFDQLCEGATVNDLNELEHTLNCSLPPDVRESLMAHDGQERGGLPTGIVFSSMLLDCEEIVQEWENWRKVNLEFLAEQAQRPKLKTVVGNSSAGSNQASSSKTAPPPANGGSSQVWQQDLAARQNCCPPNAVQKVYAHPAWIPLVRDWGGNNLAVDLAPGPAGKWGQVILFGRDYDTKYVIARSWSAFLALLADDLTSKKTVVDEDTNELKLKEFKTTRVEPSYFDILRWRMDEKYGRRVAKRRSMAPPKTGGGGSPASLSPTGSPYLSPTESAAPDSRGRSMQRPNGHSPLASPNRLPPGKSSPLARVAEEVPLPAPMPKTLNAKSPKLVEIDTPRPSEDGAAPRIAALTRAETGSSEKGKEPEITPPVAVKMNGKQPERADENMRTIEI